MAQVSDLLSDTPELRRVRNSSTRFPETTLLSPLSLSDSDSEPEFDIDIDIDVDPTPAPIFEPLFGAFPEEQHHHHHGHHHHYHQHDVSFMNSFFHRDNPTSAADGPGWGPYFGPGWSDPQRCRLSGEGEKIIGGSEVNLELGLGLGSSSQSNFDEEPPRRFDGLRVANLDSDTDSEGWILQDFDYDDHNNGNNNQGFGGVSDFDRPPFCWDYLGFNNRTHDDHNINMNEENERVNDDDFLYDVGGGEGGEAHSVVDESDDVDTGVSFLFDAYQEREEQREVTIESDIEEGGGDFGVEDAIRDLEWEILLAVNNFNREVYDMDFNVDMYEAILGEVEERMNEWRGSPPAAEAVIENLPAVKLLNDGASKENEVVCAICRDDVSREEVVRKLPCLHYYHGDCIVPWLKIRNTCPVCRYELPTDDAEYECRKREREGPNVDAIDDELTLDSQVSHDYHVFL